MNNVDIIVDLQYGDCGKGKVAHHLIQTKKYTHVIRYNGGGNAGHTIYHKGVKIVTHQVPAGVFFGIKSIIGPGCVVHVKSFLAEMEYLKKAGVKTDKKVFIAKNAHIVTEELLAREAAESAIGTTKQGIGPTYSAKASRTGVRAESVSELKPYLIDMYEEFYVKKGERLIMAEGAQGFGLDIDWGDYPYVTSSHATMAGALTNGFTHKDVKEVWGIGKVYETYVGAKQFEPADALFDAIRVAGEEFGATTGRPRQCNWIDLDLLKKATVMNGVTHVVLSKMDVLDAVSAWGYITKGKSKRVKSAKELQTIVTDVLVSECGVKKKNIFFSVRKDGI